MIACASGVPTSLPNSVEIERGFQSLFRSSEELGRQRAGPLGELRVIERGDLVVYGKAYLREPGDAVRDFNQCESGLALRTGSLQGDHNGQSPGRRLIEANVGNHDDGTPSRLPGARSRDKSAQ